MLIVLLVLAAFFSIAETSMMSLNRYRLKHLAQHGHRGAKKTAHLLSMTDRLLGVILLGNNLINAAAAAIVTIAAVRLFGNNQWAVTLATLFVTFLILVFSEITPKVIGASFPEKLAFPASYVLSPLLKLLAPIVWFVNLFVKALLWIMRIKPHSDGTTPISLPELRTLVVEAGHYIPHQHQSILLNLFELEKITVDDVMVPRGHVEAIDLEESAETILHQLATSHHTRVAVYRKELNSVMGIAHVRKIMHIAQSEEFTVEELEKALSEPYFVPAGTPLLTQLQHFQDNQQRLGLVVDEYGELQGLVTLEDILEEIVGEFTTTSPGIASEYHQQPDGSWMVDGATLLRDLNRKLGLKLPLDGPKTLNGLILEHLQDIPEPGTSFQIAGHTIEAIHIQDHVVKVARLFPPRETALSEE